MHHSLGQSQQPCLRPSACEVACCDVSRFPATQQDTAGAVGKAGNGHARHNCFEVHPYVVVQPGTTHEFVIPADMEVSVKPLLGEEGRSIEKSGICEGHVGF